MNKRQFKRRISSVRRSLSLTKSRAFISFTPNDLRYLTGLNSSNACCILTSDKFIIITDSRYKEESLKLNSLAEIFICEISIIKTLASLFSKNTFVEILLQTEKHPIKLYKDLIKIFGERKIKLNDRLLDCTISIHDGFAIESISKAVRIAEKSFLQIIPYVKEGISEHELQTELRYRLNINGSEEENFSPIVLFGKNSSLPHGKSKATKLKLNSPILIDWGAVVNGYYSDLTRNIYFGRPSEKYLQVHEIVLRANQFSIEKIIAGTNVKTLHNSVIEYFSKYKLASYFGHALGHGLGLDLHSYPRISKNSDDELFKNQIVTIEPGLYIPSCFGVRIEDDILIKGKGNEVLSRLPRELIII